MSRSSTFLQWGNCLVLEIGRDEQLKAELPEKRPA
jgi:hypothetical protein